MIKGTLKIKQILYIFFAILFLSGCHHNAHIRTQRPLSPSETVFSGNLTPFPISLGNKVDFWGNKPEKSIGILGMRSELSFLSGLKNNQEIGAYAGFGLGSFVSGNIYGLHYKKYKYVNCCIFSNSGLPKNRKIKKIIFVNFRKAASHKLQK